MQNSLRVAGWATLAYAIGFFVTFVVNSTVYTLMPGSDLPLPGEMADGYGYGIVFMLLWSISGAALIVAAPALSAVVWPDGGLAARIASAFGVVTGAAWLISGCAGAVQRTAMLNGNIMAAGADAATERALVESLFSLVYLGGMLFAVTAVPWLGMVAVRSVGRLPRTVTVFLWIAAIATLAGYVITGAQFGFMVVMISFAVIGGVLLRRAARLRRADTAATSPPAGATVPTA